MAALYLRCAQLVEPTDYPESMALHGRAVAIAPVSDGAGILARKKLVAVSFWPLPRRLGMSDQILNASAILDDLSEGVAERARELTGLPPVVKPDKVRFPQMQPGSRGHEEVLAFGAELLQRASAALLEAGLEVSPLVAEALREVDDWRGFGPMPKRLRKVRRRLKRERNGAKVMAAEVLSRCHAIRAGAGDVEDYLIGSFEHGATRARQELACAAAAFIQVAGGAARVERLVMGANMARAAAIVVTLLRVPETRERSRTYGSLYAAAKAVHAAKFEEALHLATCRSLDRVETTAHHAALSWGMAHSMAALTQIAKSPRKPPEPS